MNLTLRCPQKRLCPVPLHLPISRILSLWAEEQVSTDVTEMCGLSRQCLWRGQARGHWVGLWPPRVPRGPRSPSSWGGREGPGKGPTEGAPQSWGESSSVQADCGLHTPTGAEPALESAQGA